MAVAAPGDGGAALADDAAAQMSAADVPLRRSQIPGNHRGETLGLEEGCMERRALKRLLLRSQGMGRDPRCPQQVNLFLWGHMQDQ